jgi:hypothetical protein
VFEMPGLRVESVEQEKLDSYLSTAKFDLSFRVRERSSDGGSLAGLDGTLEFAANLFDRDIQMGGERGRCWLPEDCLKGDVHAKSGLDQLDQPEG